MSPELKWRREYNTCIHTKSKKKNEEKKKEILLLVESVMKSVVHQNRFSAKEMGELGGHSESIRMCECVCDVVKQVDGSGDGMSTFELL